MRWLPNERQLYLEEKQLSCHAWVISYSMHSRVSLGVPIVAQWIENPNRIHEEVVLFLASFSGLRIWCCHDYGIASSCSCNLTPSSETSICLRCSPKKNRKEKKRVSPVPRKNILKLIWVFKKLWNWNIPIGSSFLCFKIYLTNLILFMNLANFRNHDPLKRGLTYSMI